jgi:large subunit ribosomal protein L30
VSDRTERRLVIRWRKSAIGQKAAARRTLAALGLKRVNQTVVHRDEPSVRGMIARVRHLVDVEEKHATA